MTLQGYYNRFNASDNYDDLLFRASRGLQSAELNEIQSVLSDRIQKIANVLFKDGSIVRDGAATIDAATGAVNGLDGIVCQTLTTTIVALILSHFTATSLPG